MEKGDCLSGICLLGIYSIGSIAECNKNTATMLLEALSLGIYLWLPMAVLTNYGSWNQKNLSVFQNACGSKNHSGTGA